MTFSSEGSNVERWFAPSSLSLFALISISSRYMVFSMCACIRAKFNLLQYWINHIWCSWLRVILICTACTFDISNDFIIYCNEANDSYTSPWWKIKIYRTKLIDFLVCVCVFVTQINWIKTKKNRKSNMKSNLPSRLIPTAIHFFSRQYWQRLRLMRRMLHCWFFVHGRYWIFCCMDRLKNPCFIWMNRGDWRRERENNLKLIMWIEIWLWDLYPMKW